jgi:hypothetical protein
MSTAESIPEMVDGVPSLSGWEREIENTLQKKAAYDEYLSMKSQGIQSTFAIALHMHQPLIIEGDLHTGALISNLKYMIDHQDIHEYHDGPVFAWCYSRMADFIRELVDAGRQPRIMLDYSGCLLFGLRQMGRGDILENLKTIVHNEKYRPFVEWLGTFWGHAVAASTPVPDFKLHLRAWQSNFAAIFGLEALSRVRGFSPPEMNLPNHPDVCYEYIQALRECGYKWILVQEHSIEEIDGQGLRERYMPRRLVARNSHGDEVSITALIKTQGSDTKLVGQMQPFFEAKGQHPRDLKGNELPPIVLQISDGENGGVMMNEFPENYKKVWYEADMGRTAGLNGSEYLGMLAANDITEDDFMPVQPINQNAIWQRVGKRPTPKAVENAIKEAKEHNARFAMEGGSWTNNLSWVKNYEAVLNPMHKLSVLFHSRTDNRPVDKRSHAYRSALIYLLASQTSDYRYWGEGRWTDFAKEIIRRGEDIVQANWK